MASNKPLSNLGIAITRPINQAKNLTELIESAGGNTISYPLIEITPLNDYSQFQQVIADIDTFDWIIFISSNAVQNGMPHLIKQGIPAHLKFAAIGPVTAQNLNAFGINQVLIPESRFDSESLLSLSKMHNIQGKKVMITRGIGGREVLANTLTARGASVAFAECYQRINPQTNCDILEQAHAKQQLHAIVVTSSEAMRHLIKMAGDTDWLKQVTLYVNHTRVATQAFQTGLIVKIADAPGDDAMLKMMITNN